MSGPMSRTSTGPRRARAARALLSATAFLLALTWAGGATAAPDEVRDARGALIGTVLTGEPDPSARAGAFQESLVWVAGAIDGVPVRLLVGESGPWDTKDLEPLRYESDDCTGAGLLAAGSDADAPRRALTFDTMVFWAQGTGESREVRSIGWPLRDDEPCTAEPVSARFCCARLVRPATVRVAPVDVVDLASLGFSPPFRVVDAER